MADTASKTTRTAPGRGRRKDVSVEDLLVGRLTLLALRNQLDTRVAELKAQLVVVETQLRQCVDLLGRADEKLARQDPAVHAALTGRAEGHRPEAGPARVNPPGPRKASGAKATRKRPRP